MIYTTSNDPLGKRCLLYLRTSDGDYRLFGTLVQFGLTLRQDDSLNVGSFGIDQFPPFTISTPRFELSATLNGEPDAPTLPLPEQLALAVLQGDDVAVWPLIDSLLEQRDAGG